VDELLEKGPNRFRFYTDRNQKDEKLKNSAKDNTIFRFNNIVLALLVLFTGVLGLSYFVILCDKLLI
jgi:hypothetical protein